MIRRFFCLVLLIGFAVPCFAQHRGSEVDKVFTADVLIKMLYAKTPDEIRFCEYVIQKRNDGTLPMRIFYGVYQHAVTKDRGRRFAYFKSALEIVCKTEGVTLYPTPPRSQSGTPTESIGKPVTIITLFSPNQSGSQAKTSKWTVPNFR